MQHIQLYVSMTVNPKTIRTVTKKEKDKRLVKRNLQFQELRHIAIWSWYLTHAEVIIIKLTEIRKDKETEIRAMPLKSCSPDIALVQAKH